MRLFPALRTILAANLLGEITFGVQFVFGERLGQRGVELVCQSASGFLDPPRQLTDFVLDGMLYRHLDSRRGDSRLGK